MITVNELREVLRSIGFVERNDVFSNSYSSGASIDVNFKEKKIIYSPVDEDFKEGLFPTKEKQANGFVIHRDTTLNFSANENFVCLICVHFLLKKGYEAKHIVFEPAFKVGHVNKPSYGDILVFDKEYNPLVLIENKTFGTEFSKEWNLMQKDGGQLFSYLGPLVNEMGLCENLALFAADFDDIDIIPKSHIITLRDNEKRIAELENPKTFADAKGKYFEVWNETYAKSFETKGLFEDDIAPYTIGKLKYTISDLKGLSHAEIKPIYHEFATILRNNAITDFEHSFYILIDLFLCKITDELNNPDDLQFYYKGVTRDTPKEYCSRLLKLYKQGKKQLFDVEVVNKEEEDIKQIFEDTNRSITNGLFAGIKELFEEIKFYNIKKFNFIDVENKEEFDMNFQILIKIAALIQDINLSSSETNHFFGDLFEGLLSKNVHQTEGQFFTPLPIVNFIIKSMPEFPDSDNVKVLDYACGAGHFLTEFVKHYPKAKIYGIEKSQTLSQVAKIATIINGSNDSRIIFKDALSYINTTEAKYVSFDKESFDCIIANPPYSVKGFIETLDEKDRNQFELIKEIDEKAYSSNNSIECFFIERAKYFLKPNGIMGIILPSSLLSNEGLYVKTRELLFANFNILAISAMNSRTFGSTQRIEKLLNKVKGNKTKIPQNEIMENGKIPVVSQNRNGIIEGYTDYEEVITDLPLIVFGDHSCAIKYIDFPFVRGADGTQLIKVNEEKIKSQYLYYYLNSIQIENADKYERHFKYLKTTLVPIPPISVQNKIIDKCIAVDAEIKKANEKIGDLEEKINALVKNINGVKYKLGKIAQFKNGLNYDKSSAGEEVSIVGVADFKDNKSPIWDDVEKVVINGKLEDSFLLQKNDLLTVRSNGSQELVGRFMIVNKDLEEKTTFSGFTIRVRPDSEVVKSEFLYYILSSPIIRKQLVVGSNGSNIKSLNQTLLANVEISIPSMKKQEEILSELLAIENQIIEQRSIIEFGQEKKNRIIEDELI